MFIYNKNSMLLVVLVWLVGTVALSACGSKAVDNLAVPASESQADLVVGTTDADAEEVSSPIVDAETATMFGFNIRGWT